MHQAPCLSARKATVHMAEDQAEALGAIVADQQHRSDQKRSPQKKKSKIRSRLRWHASKEVPKVLAVLNTANNVVMTTPSVMALSSTKTAK